MNANTIFQVLGFSLLSVDGGVYHLRRSDEHGNPAGDVVGLLFSGTPLTEESRYVKLFLQDVVGDVPAQRIIFHWQTLDARRFEESGLDPLEVELQPGQVPEPALPQNFTRPDGSRTRHATKLATGEVVCYN